MTGYFADSFFVLLVQKGGCLMYPILLCSVLAIAIFIERTWSLRRKKVFSPEVLSQVKKRLREGRLKKAIQLCLASPGPMTNSILAGISSFDRGDDAARRSVEDAGRHEVPQLERYLPWLSTIASITPLLGLLGTVTGIIKVFDVISSQGPGNPNALAGGISEALLTTAAGLTVGIFALVFHNYLANRIDRHIVEMEKISLQLLDLMFMRSKNIEDASSDEI